VRCLGDGIGIGWDRAGLWGLEASGVVVSSDAGSGCGALRACVVGVGGGDFVGDGVRDGCGVGASCMGCVVEEVERDWVAVGFLPCWNLLTRMEGADYEKGTLIRPKEAGF
jgi:hypothetical protein